MIFIEWINFWMKINRLQGPCEGAGWDIRGSRGAYREQWERQRYGKCLERSSSTNLWWRCIILSLFSFYVGFIAFRSIKSMYILQFSSFLFLFCFQILANLALGLSLRETCAANRCNEEQVRTNLYWKLYHVEFFCCHLLVKVSHSRVFFFFFFVGAVANKSAFNECWP